MGHKYLVERDPEPSRRRKTAGRALVDALKVIETGRSLDQTKELSNLTVIASVLVAVGFILDLLALNR
jgi:hypothetical protein